MNFIKKSLLTSLVGGLFYLLARYILHQADLDFSMASDWLFRIVLIVFISWTVISLKIQKRGWITFVEGFRAGMWTTFFLSIFMAMATWYFCEIANPNYTADLEKTYREFHYNQMMRNYIGEYWGRDTITQGAIDTVQRGLDLNIKNYTGHLFTTGGQVQTSLFYSFFWGLAAAASIALMARKVDENT